MTNRIPTGQKDIDGIKIYTGDILRGGYGIPGRSVVGLVVQDKEKFIVRTPGHTPDHCTIKEAVDILRCQIVGDIDKNFDLWEVME